MRKWCVVVLWLGRCVINGCGRRLHNLKISWEIILCVNIVSAWVIAWEEVVRIVW